jgi:hypothetical protein
VNRNRILLLIAGASLAALLWREYPSMVRYIKMERM